ncbi:Spy/CpxP family protein refolding chaperone [Caulobacter sp. S45]|uniref:Spy/CpxP family protein refolding chaperone n=1 Tax=Caulobacter sp. S45 TaxID=1641861 RepID=UPI00157702FD|nr:Spy/CpxP family protein refolding chaperone [Caulobacter sp. S45]
MTPTSRLLTALAASVVLAATSGAVQAQPQGPGGPAGPQQPDFSAALHLRPEQQGAYAAFKTASQPSPDEMSRMRAGHQGLSSLSTPARLDRIASTLRLQQEMFMRYANATRTFYGQLSPDQQHTFDQITAPPTGRGRPQG